MFRTIGKVVMRQHFPYSELRIHGDMFRSNGPIYQLPILEIRSLRASFIACLRRFRSRVAFLRLETSHHDLAEWRSVICNLACNRIYTDRSVYKMNSICIEHHKNILHTASLSALRRFQLSCGFELPLLIQATVCPRGRHGVSPRHQPPTPSLT